MTQQQNFCANCGAKVTADMTVCPNCGATLKAVEVPGKTHSELNLNALAGNPFKVGMGRMDKSSEKKPTHAWWQFWKRSE